MLASLDQAKPTMWLTKEVRFLIAGSDRGDGQFKRLVLNGYDYSEAGATQKVQYLCPDLAGFGYVAQYHAAITTLDVAARPKPNGVRQTRRGPFGRSAR